MNKPATKDDAAQSTAGAPAGAPKEKILFEIQPLLLPTIINIENLVLIGFTVVIAIAFVIFHLGVTELLLIGLFYLLIAVPSFRSIFRAGSTSYVLTNRRLVIFSVGIRNKELSIPLEQIKDVKIKTSGLQRFYRAGDIYIYPKNLGRPTRMFGISDCKKKANAILQAVKQAKES
jgi:hypothetical protein